MYFNIWKITRFHYKMLVIFGMFTEMFCNMQKKYTESTEISFRGELSL